LLVSFTNLLITNESKSFVFALANTAQNLFTTIYSYNNLV
ncbi:27650_t:CDS:1, partial [Dentiscutata erythropus]